MARPDTRKWHRYLYVLAREHCGRRRCRAVLPCRRAHGGAVCTREWSGRPHARRRSASSGTSISRGAPFATMDEQHAASERRAHLASDFLGDVRVAVRALRRSPGLVAVVGLTFALGIGVTGAMYSVVDNLLFKPLPGAHGASLVVLGRTEERLPQPHDSRFPTFATIVRTRRCSRPWRRTRAESSS